MEQHRGEHAHGVRRGDEPPDDRERHGMFDRSGLGRPRGPTFLPPPPPAPRVPPRTGAPQAAPEPAPASGGRGRYVLAVVALAAILIGGLTGAGAAWFFGPSRDGMADYRLPRSSAGPVAAPGDLSDVAARALPSVVSVRVNGPGVSGNGSGFIVDGRGHILTNNHVVEAGDDYTVIFHDGRQRSAALVGRDPGNDLAVLRVDDTGGMRPLPLGRSSDVQVGEPVLAIGSPLGLSGTVTAGIVSALDRKVRLAPGISRTAIQTDAPINLGNSGGPLVNSRGEAVGVNTAIATLHGNGSGSIGIGFAIPIDRAAASAEHIIRSR